MQVVAGAALIWLLSTYPGPLNHGDHLEQGLLVLFTEGFSLQSSISIPDFICIFRWFIQLIFEQFISYMKYAPAWLYKNPASNLELPSK